MDHVANTPRFSFCMSTYKRPVFLQQQLQLILQQQFVDFEIVISDNDPLCSGESVVLGMDDTRVKYFPNKENIGMMPSFNKSIERATGTYIIMITDDDPVLPDMLQSFNQLTLQYPGYGVYMGCSRTGKTEGAVELFDSENFLFQILHPSLTANLLWSSCIIKRTILQQLGGVPDYGSPHLADHAMMALCGAKEGGVMINKMYSALTAHDANFSKGNLSLYYVACKEFYNLIVASVPESQYIKNGENVLLKHLERWLLIAIFSLKKYYTYASKDPTKLAEIKALASNILQLPFMKCMRPKFYSKEMVFTMKRLLHLAHIKPVK